MAKMCSHVAEKIECKRGTVNLLHLTPSFFLDYSIREKPGASNKPDQILTITILNPTPILLKQFAYTCPSSRVSIRNQ